MAHRECPYMYIVLQDGGRAFGPTHWPAYCKGSIEGSFHPWMVHAVHSFSQRSVLTGEWKHFRSLILMETTGLLCQQQWWDSVYVWLCLRRIGWGRKVCYVSHVCLNPILLSSRWYKARNRKVEEIVVFFYSLDHCSCFSSRSHVQSITRQHLVQCMEKQTLIPFPTK